MENGLTPFLGLVLEPMWLAEAWIFYSRMLAQTYVSRNHNSVLGEVGNLQVFNWSLYLFVSFLRRGLDPNETDGALSHHM